MKVIDIVKTVATFLARENVLAYLEKGEGETSDENYGDALNQIDYMVRCSNLVINELAGSFVPMIKREKVVVNDGKIYYGTLNENATEIISVSNEYADNIWLLVTGEEDMPKIMIFIEADERALAILKSSAPHIFPKKI